MATKRNIPTPRQDELFAVVRANPGIITSHAAQMVGPNGDRCFGYLTVKRALRAGRVRQVRAEKGNVTYLYAQE